MSKIVIRIILIIAILLLLTAISFVGYGIYKKTTLNIPNPVATIEIEDYGNIKIELYPDNAPNTVANFIRLANRGFFTNSNFHRVVPEFVIQGGAKNGDTLASPTLEDIYDLNQVLNEKEIFEKILDEFYDGEYTVDGKTITSYSTFETYKKSLENNETIEDKFEDFLDVEYSIKGEFLANEYDTNNLRHEEGVISMARSDYTTYGYYEESYNSAGSQFFIMVGDNSYLNGLYAPFGKVVEGMDIVEKISNLEVYYRSEDVDEDFEVPKDDDGNNIESDTPKEKPIIKSVTVETYGVDYGIPEVIKTFDINSMFSGLNY